MSEYLVETLSRDVDYTFSVGQVCEIQFRRFALLWSLKEQWQIDSITTFDLAWMLTLLLKNDLAPLSYLRCVMNSIRDLEFPECKYGACSSLSITAIICHSWTSSHVCNVFLYIIADSSKIRCRDPYSEEYCPFLIDIINQVIQIHFQIVLYIGGLEDPLLTETIKCLFLIQLLKSIRCCNRVWMRFPLENNRPRKRIWFANGFWIWLTLLPFLPFGDVIIDRTCEFEDVVIYSDHSHL